jgi:hypothetical protein
MVKDLDANKILFFWVLLLGIVDGNAILADAVQHSAVDNRVVDWRLFVSPSTLMIRVLFPLTMHELLPRAVHLRVGGALVDILVQERSFKPHIFVLNGMGFLFQKRRYSPRLV